MYGWWSFCGNHGGRCRAEIDAIKYLDELTEKLEKKLYSIPPGLKKSIEQQYKRYA